MLRFLNKYLIIGLLFVAATSFAETEPSQAALYNECPTCGTKYSYDIKFCGKDGGKLVETQKSSICPKCNQNGVPGEVFCRVDGEKLVTVEEIKVNEEVLLENRQNALEHYYEGDKFLDSEEYGKALAEYKKAVELYENIPGLQYNIGLLYGKIGKHKDAIKHLRKYCKLSPDAEDIDSVITKIAVLQGILDKKNKLKRKYENRNDVMTKALQGIKEKCDMVFVSAGAFVMGSDGMKREQRPRHKVHVNAFYIDRYEVTNAQYYEFLDYINKTDDHSKCRKDEPINKDHKPHNWEKDYYNHPEYPVVRIDWYDASAYAAWAGKRLPTEAEWEKAARGTDERKWPWGSEWDPSKYNVGNPEPVGSHEEGKSPYGCYDMAGSVAEWCADWFSMNYYEKSPKRNPKGPEKGEKKVIRGGSRFISIGLLLRSTARKAVYPNIGNMSVGFRCVK
jgi:formylglycine-generating enzyme required for sulfatase activity